MVKHPRESRYSKDVNRINEMKEIFEMHFVHHMQEKEILSLKGLNKGTYYQILRKFAAEYPELAEQMKKKGRDIVPDDYRKLLEEVSTLKTQLKKEKLRHILSSRSVNCLVFPLRPTISMVMVICVSLPKRRSAWSLSSVCARRTMALAVASSGRCTSASLALGTA